MHTTFKTIIIIGRRPRRKINKEGERERKKNKNKYLHELVNSDKMKQQKEMLVAR